MAEIKSMTDIANKWASVTPQRAGEYAKGVKAPKRSWAQATADASDAQAAGVQAAIAEGRFAKGVQAAGDAKWSRKAAGVGASRFGSGVTAAKGDYQTGFAPYASVIQGVTLPPRGAKGDPRNYDRVTAIGTALHDAKTGSSS